MRLIKYTDDNGYKHLKWVRDHDPDSASGIPGDPPDLNNLDWEEIKKELHNSLVEKGLVDWSAVQASQTGLSSTIVTVLKRRLIIMYRS